MHMYILGLPRRIPERTGRTERTAMAEIFRHLQKHVIKLQIIRPFVFDGMETKQCAENISGYRSVESLSPLWFTAAITPAEKSSLYFSEQYRAIPSVSSATQPSPS